ncbi:c-type cytochrome [Ancylomarina salipaludis]|uniref:C-type cytochrome n=1 Tax=Ancylomarina salipaludis TaxID=2501299 RepID=A0A4Q1JNY0_9BACT|nr:cytochrome c [Ancylomarina salipaludis]RXQ96588.1 c-type cytochrome [Ancylomarina salipaludis]
MKNTFNILATIILVLSLSATVCAEGWDVPASVKKKQNPYELTKRNISSGKKIFQTTCKSCHGDPGKGNMLPLQPPPTDLGSQNFLVQTDGEIFHKIRTGKGAMPTFEKTLSDESKWMVIAYLRSLDKMKREAVVTKAVVNPEVTDVKIDIDVDSEHKKLIAELTGLKKDGKRVGLEGIELSFLVKRAFGQLDISGEEAYTNEKGQLIVQFPTDLPGDREGQANLLVKITDEDNYGPIEEKRVVSIAVPTNPKNILSERAMWGTRANAPIWIIATYVLGVIGIWGVIFLILFQLFQLSKMRVKSK